MHHSDQVSRSREVEVDIYGVSDDEEAPLQRQLTPVIQDPMLVEPQFFLSDPDGSKE